MSSSSERCPRSVVLIEDDESISRPVITLLEEQGYHVECAEDVETAFDVLLRIERPALVLVDLLTMRFDWTKLVDALEYDDRLATLPVVVAPVNSPELFSRPFASKKPLDAKILLHILEAHCCRGTRGGAPDAAGIQIP